MLDDLVAQDQVLGHLGAAQVEVAVAQPQLLVDVALVGDRERRGLQRVQHRQRVGEHLDLAGRQVRGSRCRAASADLALDFEDELGAALAGEGVRLGRALRVEDDLHQTRRSRRSRRSGRRDRGSGGANLAEGPSDRCRGADLAAGMSSSHGGYYIVSLSAPAWDGAPRPFQMPITFANPTLVDALVLVLIGLYVLEDVRNGILYGLVQLAGLLLALLAALLFYSRRGRRLVGASDGRRASATAWRSRSRSAASGC